MGSDYTLMTFADNCIAFPVTDAGFTVNDRWAFSNADTVGDSSSAILFARPNSMKEQGMADGMKQRGKRGIYYADTYARSPQGQRLKLQDCLGTNDKELAKIHLRQLIATVERGEYSKQKKTFSDLVEEYKTNPDKFLAKSKSNQERIECILRKHLFPFFGNKRLSQIKRLPGNEDDDSISIIGYKSHREKSGAKPSTLVKELRLIQEIIRLYDSGWKLPTKEETADMVFKNKPDEVEEFLEEEDIYQILEHLPKKYRKLSLVSAYTGFRLGDVCYLEHNSINFKQGWIKIVQRKTGHKVKVPIHPKLKAVLKSIPTPIHLDKRLFPDCNPKAISTAFRRACERAGKIGFHFHDLRHFCASYLINNGTPLFTVSKYLGHRSVKTTEIYAHLNDENLEGAGDAFTDNVVCKLDANGFLNYQSSCK
jgi:integrase